MPGESPPPAALGGYRLVELLGRGGMGEVYRAERDGPGGYRRRAAIKRILPRYQNDPTLRARFLAEARTNARLEHPNIVQVLDFGDQPEPYLVLEFVEGITIARVLKQCADTGARIPVPVAAFLVAEAATGLDYAHRRQDDSGRDLQIVHRDVSPQNILVSIDGAVKISDFGIARAADNQLRTAAGISVGKLSYMAPEQARGQPVDCRADVFALGVMLWEVLLVRPLIPRNDSNAAIQMLLAGRFDAPSRIDPSLPPIMDRIVLDALAVDPQRRTPSAGQLAQQLRGVVHAMSPGFDSGELVRSLARLVPDVRWQATAPNVNPAWPGAPDPASGFGAPIHPSLPEVDGATRVFLDPVAASAEGHVLPLAGGGRAPGLPVATPAVPSFHNPASGGFASQGPVPSPFGPPQSGSHPSGSTPGNLSDGMPPRPPTRVNMPGAAAQMAAAQMALPMAPPIAPPMATPMATPMALPVAPAYGAIPSSPVYPQTPAPKPAARAASGGTNLVAWIVSPLIVIAMVIAAVLIYIEVTHDAPPPPAPIAIPAPVAAVPVDPLAGVPVPTAAPTVPVAPRVTATHPPDPYVGFAQSAVALSDREVQRCLHRFAGAGDLVVATVVFNDATGHPASVIAEVRGGRATAEGLHQCVVTAITNTAIFAPPPGATGVSAVVRTWQVPPRSGGGGGGGGGAWFPFSHGG